jgi:hypothetical protein
MALGESSVEARQRAVRDIQVAIALEPANHEHWLVLGKLRVMGEYDSEARACFRRAIVLGPGDLRGYLELAAAWKRDWTRYLDTLAVRRAMGVLDTACALRPAAADPWLNLVPLRRLTGDLRGARSAAERALAGSPRRPEAVLAAACIAYHEGEIERSDSLFRRAISRLDPVLRSLLQEPAALLGESAEAMSWSEHDPDPTTPENEIQLEYWARVADAFLLYYDLDRPGLDARARTYVQYGAPPHVGVNPPGTPLYFRTFASQSAPPASREAVEGGNPGKPPVDFPTPVQVWQYPELGVRMVLQDRSLHGRYEPQAIMDDDPGARPDPRLLAGRDDLLAIGDGLAVFHRLPPRERRIETRAVVARFGGPRSPRLIAQVEVPGGPADSIRARWVVSNASGRALARGEQQLGVAACDPVEHRAGQFAADLPPGSYQVTISVRVASGRRGLFQTRTVLEPAPAGLALSDLVLACGDPTLLVGGGSARFDADLDARVPAGRPLVGYLEIYRLTPAPDGLSRFAYECLVSRVPGAHAARPRTAQAAPVVATSREEVHLGNLRRQFLSVPVQSLAPGRYRLEVRVQDQVSGAIAKRSVEFVRE